MESTGGRLEISLGRCDLVEPTPEVAGRFLYVDVSAFNEPIGALQAFRVAPQEFAAVVSDVSMAGMSGLDLAGEIPRLRADVPVVLTSGYLESGTTTSDARSA